MTFGEKPLMYVDVVIDVGRVFEQGVKSNCEMLRMDNFDSRLKYHPSSYLGRVQHALHEIHPGFARIKSMRRISKNDIFVFAARNGPRSDLSATVVYTHK